MTLAPTRRATLAGAASLGASLALPRSATAQATPRRGGTLRFNKRNYEITVGGLGIGGIGASRLTATGSVYRLSNVEDFTGAYLQVREGWALGDQGRGTLWLRNAKGVVMRLATKRRGLQLSLGADGVLIGFKQ